MSRLFITPRELNFISDTTKELVKDVIGQKIYYYAINEHKTRVDDVYNESTQKVYDKPIVIDALVDNKFQVDTKINEFGVDQQYKIEVFIQYRDLVDKGINVAIGDFFSFSDIFYEITDETIIRNIYGLPEHKDGVRIIGTKAREHQFKALTLGPTDISRPEADAVQTTFYQQRGETENAEGATGDVRVLQSDSIAGKPITGAKEVSSQGDTEGSGHSSFYGDEE